MPTLMGMEQEKRKVEKVQDPESEGKVSSRGR